MLKQGDVITGSYQWQIGKELGRGTFGVVFVARRTDGTEYAVKASKEKEQDSLWNETSTLIKIHSTCKASNIPLYFDNGTSGQCRFLVIERLGTNLEKLLVLQERKRFSASTALRAFGQVLTALSYVHQSGFVHRDIKPENILVGAVNQKIIYLTDFGLAASFVEDGKSVGTKPGLRCGTIWFSSINTHLSRRLTPADDVISWFYALTYCTVGNLPWDNVATWDEALEGKRKSLSSFDEFKFEPDVAKHFRALFDDVGKCGMTPDYNALWARLNTTLEELRVDYQEPFDWERVPPAQGDLVLTEAKKTD